MEEIWKDIPNYEGMYQVSNLGRVKSLERFVKQAKGGYTQKESLLKPYSMRGYDQIVLCKNSIRKSIQVHQLIAIVFLNHKPNGNKIVVDHINTIKNDNRLENLQLITNRKNLSKDKNGYSSKYIGVCFVKDINKFKTNIYINNKSIHLGYYNNEIEASEIYQLALKNIKHYNGNPKEFREYLSNFY